MTNTAHPLPFNLKDKMATSMLYNSSALLVLGVCCILSLTPLGIHECLYNGHKLLRQTLEIDFCLRRDLAQKKKKENRWNGETTSATQSKEKKKDKMRE